MGLHHLVEIDDHALITTLVERWWCETNSFQATVTLEDVAYLYKLPIDGLMVVLWTFPRKMVKEVCQYVLGITPHKKLGYVWITVKI